MAEYDLIVFGVTGFTGRFVAEEIYRIQTGGRQSLKWAVAGRSESKVGRVLRELGIEGVDVVVADVNDEESIEAMCARTRVVVNVVGPYVKYGEVVVRSCIKHKCDYVDITGETYFAESMMVRYGDQAREAGVYIVNFCAFDCIPNDIGTLVLHKAFNGELAYVENYMETKCEALNTGTWESFLLGMRNQKKKSQLRQANACLRPQLPNVPTPKRRFLFYSDVTRSWCVLTNGADTACILRSAQNRNETEGVPMIGAQVYFSVGTLLQLILWALVFLIVVPLNSTDWGYNLLRKYPGLFSLGQFRKGGPSKKQIQNGSFNILINGVGYGPDNTDKSKLDAKLKVTVRGAEPGYVATSAMLVQSALCLLDERADLPKEGGIYTPAVAFGNTNIVQNLEGTGKIKFTVEQ